MSDLDQALEKVLVWSNATFPKATLWSVMNHLQEELKEHRDAPEDPGEVGDVLMLIAHLSQKLEQVKTKVITQATEAGIDPTIAVLDKLEICKKRTWGDPDENGVIHHLPHGR